MSVEEMAQAMFEKLHAMNFRPRRWATHPDGDSGEEMGRDTFRAMAQAAHDTVIVEPAPVEPEPVVANDPVPPPESAA